MLEKLKEQRGVYVAELEQLKRTDLNAIKAERFEQVKEEIAAAVEQEHNDKLAAVELEISHYDFVIADEEKKIAAAEAAAVAEAETVAQQN